MVVTVSAERRHHYGTLPEYHLRTGSFRAPPAMARAVPWARLCRGVERARARHLHGNQGIAHGADLGRGAWRPAWVATRPVAAGGRDLPRPGLSGRGGTRGGPAPAELARRLPGR